MKDLQSLQSLVLPEAERRAFLDAIRPLLPVEFFERIRGMAEALPELLRVLEQKNTSIGKLREMIFGAKTESARNVCGGPPKDRPGRARGKGHGRRGQRSYTGARRVHTPHANLKPGDVCPDCQKGKVRKQKEPATTVHVSAQPPVQAVVNELERLRCDLCGVVFTAEAPPGARGGKYDLSVGVLAGTLRYGTGIPFYRFEKLQESLGVPLPASVQWEQAERVAVLLEPLFDHLLYLGAQAAVVHNDDTTMRVSNLRMEIKAEVKPERTGIFTTGIVCEADQHPVRLFFTGRAHAGENLARVLGEREPGLDPPLHMCDGLSRNTPKGCAVVDCNCNVHARRNFVDIRAAFPEESRRVVECYSEVYRVEAKAKAEKLTPEGRLKLHQALSQPVMDRLKSDFTKSLETRQVEPNSGLGQSMTYMIGRWDALTQFLRIPGAPIDNNVDERLLKTAIMHRKNSLHYKTERGAEVGDFYMSMIQTCVANGANPYDYLLSAARNAESVKKDPGRWMPWNYKEALANAAPAPPPPKP